MVAMRVDRTAVTEAEQPVVFTDLEPEPSALLGRADFFQAFEITFNEGPDAPTFSVSPI